MHLAPEVKAVRTHEQTWANFEAMLKVIATTGSAELQTCTRAILAEVGGELDAEGNLWDARGDVDQIDITERVSDPDGLTLRTIMLSESGPSATFDDEMDSFINNEACNPAFSASFVDNEPQLKAHEDTGHLCNCLNRSWIVAHSVMDNQGERMLGYNPIHPDLANQPQHNIMKHLALMETIKAEDEPYTLECVFLVDKKDTLGLRRTYPDGSQAMTVAKILKPGRSAPIAWDDKRLMQTMQLVLPATYSRV